MKQFLIIILFTSVVLPQLAIKGKQIYNEEINKYYSDVEFIELLNIDGNFDDDENFVKYKKYVNRLKFKKSKYIYGFSLMSVATGYDGIVNADEFQDDDSPPGVKNIAFGIMLSSSYYSYNIFKKKKSLYNLIQKHNNIYVTDKIIDYSKDKIIDYSLSDRWDGSISFGFLSEKTLVSIIECSGLFNIDKHSEFYLAIGSMLFGSGIGSGYKYYFKNKSSSSMFISLGSHLSYLGTSDQGMTIYGLNISPGFSIINKSKVTLKTTYREKFGGELKNLEFKKSAINIGISFLYMGDNSIGAFPFINLERRF